MKTRLLFCLAAFGLLVGYKSAGAASYTWSGSTSTLWSVATNWLPNGHPGAGDDIQIPATANKPTVDVASSCLSVTVTGSSILTLNATLTVSGGFTLNSALNIFAGGGSLNVGGLLFVNNFASLKTRPGSTITFGSINIAANASISNNAVIKSNGAVIIGYQSFISNAGALNVFGNFSAPLNAYLTNLKGSTFNMNGSSKITLGYLSYISNSGIVSVGTGNTSIGDTAYIFNASGASFTTNGTISLLFDGRITNSGTFTANSDTIAFGVSSFINNTTVGTFSETGKLINMGFKSSVTNNGIFSLKKAAVKMGASGNITNKAGATFTIDGNASIDFASNTADSAFIKNSGTFYAGTSNSVCTINLNYTSAAVKNSGTFYLGSTSVINLTGFASKIVNTGTFTLQSDVHGCAAIGNISGNSAAVSGSFNVERYITGGSPIYRGYRLLSSPVHAGSVGGNEIYSLNYVKLSSLVTGTGGIPGGFDKAGNPSLYLYRDNISPSNSSFISGNFRGVSDISAAPSYSIDVDGSGFNIPIANGFMFFFRGDRINNLANKYSPGTTAESVTMTASGTLNTGRIIVKEWFKPASFNLDYTAVAGNAAVRGFALVGNPYPSAIDWDTFNTSSSTTGIYAPNVSKFMYILDPVSNNYNVYQAGSGGIGTIATANSNIIPSGQGFFVQAASGAAAQLVFNESAKINAQANAANGNLFLGKPVQAQVNQYLRLQLAKDSINADDTYIGFGAGFSPQYVIDEDAVYMPGHGAVSLCSISSDNIPCAIDKFPLPKQQPETLGLIVNAAADGTYSLNMTQMVAIPQIYEVWLMDAYKKDSLDMRVNKSYGFDLSKADTNSFGSKRFSLVIRQNPALGIHLLNFTATKATGGSQIVWLTENEENYTNFTVERSTDGGVTFNILGGMASSGLGTYSFMDSNPSPTAANQYRLKIEDLNGTVSYSNVVTLSYGNTAAVASSNISVYPNPASGIINLAINKSYNAIPVKTNGVALTLANNQASYGIKIINITGAVIKTASSTTPSWQDDIANLSPGTYIIQVTNNIDHSLVGKSTFVKL